MFYVLLLVLTVVAILIAVWAFSGTPVEKEISKSEYQCWISLPGKGNFYMHKNTMAAIADRPNASVCFASLENELLTDDRFKDTNPLGNYLVTISFSKLTIGSLTLISKEPSEGQLKAMEDIRRRMRR